MLPGWPREDARLDKSHTNQCQDKDRNPRLSASEAKVLSKHCNPFIN